jgi:hypothetical protein
MNSRLSHRAKRFRARSCIQITYSPRYCVSGTAPIAGQSRESARSLVSTHSQWSGRRSSSTRASSHSAAAGSPYWGLVALSRNSSDFRLPSRPLW